MEFILDWASGKHETERVVFTTLEELVAFKEKVGEDLILRAPDLILGGEARITVHDDYLY